MCLLYRCRVACAHSQHVAGKTKQCFPREQSTMRAAAAACDHDVVKGEMLLAALSEYLQHGCSVSRCSERGRSTARDEIRVDFGFPADGLAGMADRCLDVRSKRRNENSLCAEQAEEQIVTTCLRRVAAPDPFLEHEITGQAFSFCGSQCQTAVIGLHSSHCHNRLGTCIERGRHDIFELACLVATARESKLIVTLDPD